MDDADVFVIDESELGHTTVVKHSIDTGEHNKHPPIKHVPDVHPLYTERKLPNS